MVVAPTGVGKSMLLSMMAAQALWAGKSVVYFTYELNPIQIRDRIALAMLGKGRSMVGGTWAEELDWEAKKRGLPAMPAGTLEIHNDAYTWPDVEARLERFKDLHGQYPEVVLLDSADDVALRGKFEKRYEGLTDTFTYLRRLAHEKHIAIWSTGQLNREAVDKARSSLRNIAEAFGKAQRSHYVIGMAQTPEHRQDLTGPKMQLYVLKDSNYGTTGAWLKCTAHWGHGDDGYPGLIVEQTHGLAIAMLGPCAKSVSFKRRHKPCEAGQPLAKTSPFA